MIISGCALAFSPACSDQADAAERYRLATAQIMHAERCGFDSASVTQHHFHEDEGGHRRRPPVP
jgi:alkanesulfonate monooxygenase SsuD/methylene tetrahydromethanopterin reductase-like flavin-dependent oxidoreductase (luciferase family)